MPEPAAGTRLNGRYVLDGRVGLGGMSEVWRAADETLGRAVAVKILSGTAAEDPLLRAAIRREARAAARMTHPHAMRVYDYGEFDTGEAVLPYIVMELVEGSTLADRLTDGPPLPWRAAARMAAEVSAALADAHRLGVVHRDIKPANVMLTPSGAAKVLDFGIATLVNVDASPLTGSFASGRTGGTEILDGWLAGTPPYAAPELLLRGEVGPPADVYAVGALLYQALTGRTPLAITSWDEAAEVHRSGTATPAPLPGSVPDALAATCLACLSRDPAARPAAAAIARIFGGYAARAGEPAHPPTTVAPVSPGPVSQVSGAASGGAFGGAAGGSFGPSAGASSGGRALGGAASGGQAPGGAGSGGQAPGRAGSRPGARAGAGGRYAPGAAAVPSAVPDLSDDVAATRGYSDGSRSASGGSAGRQSGSAGWQSGSAGWPDAAGRGGSASSGGSAVPGFSAASGFVRDLISPDRDGGRSWSDRLRARRGVGVLAGGLIVGGIGLVALAALTFGPDRDRNAASSAPGGTTPVVTSAPAQQRSPAASPAPSRGPSRTPSRTPSSAPAAPPDDIAAIGTVLNRLDAALAQGLVSRDINARAGSRLFDDLSDLRRDAADPEALSDGAADLQDRLEGLADDGDMTEDAAANMIEIADELRA